MSWYVDMSKMLYPYWIAIGFCVCLAIYQQRLIRHQDPAQCFKAFLNNNWYGGIVYAGIAASWHASKQCRPTWFCMTRHYTPSVNSVRRIWINWRKFPELVPASYSVMAMGCCVCWASLKDSLTDNFAGKVFEYQVLIVDSQTGPMQVWKQAGTFFVGSWGK